MRKSLIVIIILVAISLFAFADYYLNQLGSPASSEVTEVQPPVKPIDDVAADQEEIERLSTVFQISQTFQEYKVIGQTPVKQIFEKIDLSSIEDIDIYRHQLEKDVEEGDLLTKKPLTIYEIHGPENLGALTYLNVKLQFIAQFNAETENINETKEFDSNNFFFNDTHNASTAFLLIQISDKLFGFQYEKGDQTYEDIKAIIQTLNS